jgi:hypothetical protein
MLNLTPVDSEANHRSATGACAGTEEDAEHKVSVKLLGSQ